MPGGIDVHQHLWPAAFVDALRARQRIPHLRGWTLYTADEPPFDVDPAAHEIDKRLAREADERTLLAGVASSSPLGIQALADTALLDAWAPGTADLPRPFVPWAAVHLLEPDLSGLKALLERGFLGIQLPADAVSSPAGWNRVGDVLELAQRQGRPILVHPGPAAAAADRPGWW